MNLHFFAFFDSNGNAINMKINKQTMLVLFQRFFSLPFLKQRVFEFHNKEYVCNIREKVTICEGGYNLDNRDVM
jgi:hypothetical protein